LLKIQAELAQAPDGALRHKEMENKRKRFSHGSIGIASPLLNCTQVAFGAHRQKRRGG